MVSQELLTLSLSFFPLTLSTNFLINFLRLARVSLSLFNSSTDFCSFKNVSFDNSWCSKRRNTNGLSSSLAQNTSLEKVKSKIREKKFFHILETFQDNLSSKCFQQKQQFERGKYVFENAYGFRVFSPVGKCIIYSARIIGSRLRDCCKANFGNIFRFFSFKKDLNKTDKKRWTKPMIR
jgi:hypothetical protein